ncbi:flagellar hook assembly protein FlgD [Henriciella pelagia]|jgi:flagellar basal-body rod modification protein FlgD|uniref:Basal-body rod modification protein FlgD n=1 Tax=Henriciella pelagia TaxID=1977912 RepID=A0ABQ1JT99_9PROT|nr:flagellar hook capping FlgD N-terminal domain-containing protein [Henriciella pelagia]GGB75852.1 basal-body rod modification protein FlgD [Henriciella pelagia]
MSTVTSATNTQTNTTAQQQTAQLSQPQMGEEFDNFLKLLTAQLRNQDPLSPLDSTQFVEQLATFSSLEQQVRGNASLESMASMIGDIHAMFASEWIGKSVTVESSWVPYSGQSVDFMVNAPDAADKAILNIKDSAGETIWTKALDLSDETHSWNGQTLSGVEAQTDQIFEFGIDLYSGTNFLGTAAPQVKTTVTNVANENGTMRVGTSSNLSASVDKVSKIDDE